MSGQTSRYKVPGTKYKVCRWETIHLARRYFMYIHTVLPMPPPLRIEFRRDRRKQDTLHCFRADGSETWTKLHHNFAIHDLAHYAVESILEFTEAFYGILAEGYAIEEFEAPRAKRPAALHPDQLSAEALQTEHLVNLLLTELNYGGPLPDFLTQLSIALAQQDLPPVPRLTEERLAQIRERFRELRLAWAQLADGEKRSLVLFGKAE